MTHYSYSRLVSATNVCINTTHKSVAHAVYITGQGVYLGAGSECAQLESDA
jgi:hypothetical protein